MYFCKDWLILSKTKTGRSLCIEMGRYPRCFAKSKKLSTKPSLLIATICILEKEERMYIYRFAGMCIKMSLKRYTCTQNCLPKEIRIWC